MTEIVAIKQVIVARGQRKQVLSIDRLSLCAGELVAVVGPNGAGKSTLLQTINLLHSYEGEMRLFGQSLQGADKTLLRRRMALVFQESLLLDDTVFNNVALALRFRGFTASDRSKVQAALVDFRCDHLADRPARLLSGGEAQRVCIARALVSEPELLLLDEPFAALDATTRVELLAKIRKHAQARAITVLLVSHHFGDVLHFADRTLAMIAGRIVQDDLPEMLMRHPVNEQVARLVAMDNILPCYMEQDSQGCFINLMAGVRFLHPGVVDKAVSVCCIPGDALHLIAGKLASPNESRVLVAGVLDRVLPGVGSYQLLVRRGEWTLCVRIPRQQIPSSLQEGTPVTVAFDPAEVHLV